MVPCPGMNEHPIARMELILRQVEAPVKIYNSRWFPASIYSIKWSIMKKQWTHIKKVSCPSLNEHPIARMELILRQVEAPVKVYNSEWVPASIYNVKWSIKAGQWSNTKKIQENTKHQFFFWVLYRPRGSRGPSGRVQNPFWSWKTSKNEVF